MTEIIQAFDDFAIGEANETYERYLFNSRVQKDGDTFDMFLSSQRQLVTTCNYCDNCVNSIIRDRIVLGIDNSDTQSTLLKESKLTLERTITLCRAAENASAQHKVINPTESVHKLQRGKGRQKERKIKEGKNEESEDKICTFCGHKHKMVKSACPANGKKCSTCKKLNHFAVKCPNKRVHQVPEEPQPQSENSSEEEFVDVLHSANRKPKVVRCRLLIKHTEVIFQLDTGASVNVLPKPLSPVSSASKCYDQTSARLER